MPKKLNEMEVVLSFNADTRKAKQEIDSLQQALQNVAKLPGKASTLFGDKDIKAASNAAMELQMHLQKAFNTNTGKLDLSRLSTSLKASGQSLDQYYDKLSKAGAVGQDAFLKVARSVATAEAPVTRVNARMEEMLATLKNTARWQISSSILHGFMGTIQEAYHYAQDLNESLNNIRIVTGYSKDRMADFAVEANKAAQALSTTTTEYTDASLIFYQQGLNDKEVKERTETTIKMANVSRQSAEEVSDQMTAVWNNFNKSGDESAEHFADVMTKLGAETASSSSEIAQGLEKFAGIANTIGLSFDYASSALATITATSRETPEVVGTALKTIFARIQGLKLGGTLEDGTDLNKYSEGLAKVGIDIKNLNGEMKDADVIIDEMGAKWKQLSKDQQMALAQTVAGTRQYNQLVTLMDNFDFFEENVDRAKNAEGSLQEQQNIYAEGWEAARDRVKAAAQDIYQDLFDDEFFIGITNGLAKVLDIVDGITESFGGLKGIVATVGGIFLTYYANKVPDALKNIKQNLMVITGRSTKVMQEMQAENAKALANVQNNPKLSLSYKTQAEGIAKVNEMQQKLVLYNKQLTTSEQEAYKIRIQNVKGMYDEATALAALVEKKQQEVQAQKNYVIRETSKDITDDTKKYLQAKQTVDTVNGMESDADASEEQINEYLMASQVVEQYEEKLQSLVNILGLENIESLNSIEGKNKLKQAIRSLIDELQIYYQRFSQLEDLENVGIENAEGWREEGQNIEEVKQEMLEYMNLLQKRNQEYDLQIDDNEIDELTNSIKELGTDGGESLNTVISKFEKLISFSKEFDTLENEIQETEGKLEQLGGKISNNFKKDIGELGTGTVKLDATKENIDKESDESPLPNSEGDKLGFERGAMAATQFGSAVMSTYAVIQTVTNGFETLGKVIDGDATAMEGLGAVVGILMSTMQALNAITSLSTTLQSVNIVKTWAEKAAKDSLIVTNLGLEASQAALLVTTGAIVAAIAAVIAIIWVIIEGVKILSDIINENENAVKNSTESIQSLTESFEKSKTAADNLKKSLSDWEDANKEFESLGESAENYKEKLEEVNEKAKEIIKTNDLLYDQDYKYNEKGKIEFTQSGQKKIEENKNTLDQDQYSTQSMLINAKITRERANLNIATEKASSELVTTLYDISKLYKGRGWVEKTLAERLEKIGAATTEFSQQFKEQNNQQAPNQAEIIENLKKQKLISDSEYQKLTESASKSADSLIEYTNSVEKATEANIAYAKELNKNKIFKEYGSQIEAIAKKSGIDAEAIVNSIVNSQSAGTQQSEKVKKIEDEFGDDVTAKHVDPSYFYNSLLMGGYLNDEIKDKYGRFMTDLNGMSDKNLMGTYMEMRGFDSEDYVWDEDKGKYTIKTKQGGEIVDTQTYDEIAQLLKEGLLQEIKATASNTSNEESVSAYQDLLDSSGSLGPNKDVSEGMAKSVQEAALNGDILDLDFNTAEMTEKIRDEILETLNSDSISAEDKENFVKLLFGISDETIQGLGYESATQFTMAVANGLNNVDTQKINDAINKKYEGMVDGLNEKGDKVKVTSDMLIAYRKNLQDTYEEYQNNAKAANEVAYVNLRLDKGVRMLAEDWSTFNEAMTSGDLMSIAEVLPEVNRSVQNILNLDTEGFNLLPPDFAQKNWNLVQDVMNNVEGAVDELRDKAGEEILLKMQPQVDLDADGVIDQAYQEMHDIISSYDQTNFKVGVEIDDANFIGACQRIIDEAGMTAKTATEYFKAMGYNIEFNDEEKELKSTYQYPNVKLDPESKTPYIDDPPVIDITTTNKVKGTSIKSITPNGSYGGGIGVKNTASPSSTAKKDKGNKNKGSSKQPKQQQHKDRKDPVKELADRYHDLNKAIQDVEHSMSMLSKTQSHLKGAALVKSLKEQNKLLEQQKGNYQALNNELRKEQGELQWILSFAGGSFGADGSILNYTEVFNNIKAEYNRAVDAYNGVIDWFNSLSGDQQDEIGKTAVENAETTLKTAKETYDDANKYLKRYDEVYSELQKNDEKLKDLLYEQIENNLKAFEVEIQVKLDISEAQRKINDFLKEVNKNFKTVYTTTGDWIKLFDTAIKNAKTFTGATGTINTRLREIQEVRNIIDNPNYDYNSENSLFADRTEAVDKLKEYTDELMGEAKDLYSLYEDTWNSYLDAMDESLDQWNDILSGFEEINDTLDHYQKISEMLYGGEDTSKGRELLDSIYSASSSNSLATQSMLRQQIATLTKEYQDLVAAGAKEGDKDLKKVQDAIKDANKNLQSEIENYLDVIQNKLTNSIKSIMDTADKALTRGFGINKVNERWNDAKEAVEGYYDEVEKVYQLESLESKWEKAINDTSTIKNQQYLKALMDGQLSNLRAKTKLSEYDIQLAEKELAIYQAQMALEDARNNKNTMKLTRNEQGDWTYQYVADEDDTAAKEEELLNALYEKYEFVKQSSAEAMEAILNMKATADEKLSELMEQYKIADEERRAELAEEYEYWYSYYYGEDGLIVQKVAETQTMETDLQTAGMETLWGLYETDQDNFDLMTNNEKEMITALTDHGVDSLKTLELGRDDFYTETQDQTQAVIADTRTQWQNLVNELIKSWNTDKNSVRANVQNAYAKMMQAVAEYDAAIVRSEQASGVEWSKVNQQLQGTRNEIQQVASKIDEVIGKTDGLDAFRLKVSELENQWYGVKGAIEEAIYSLEAYLNILTGGEYGSHYDYGSGPGHSGGSGDSGGGDAGWGGGGVNEEAAYGIAQNIWTYGSWGNDPVRRGRIIERYGEETANRAQEIVNEKVRNGTADELINWDSDKWAFATGGYTGEWGKEGRLALLHQKELVLNEEDTKNILDTVNVVRSIKDSISSMVAGVTGLKPSVTTAASVSNNDNKVFNITAEFPNANSVTEIQEAILGLPNLASQWMSANT